MATVRPPGGRESCRNAEQFVAGCVAEIVIDLLETVEIEQKNGESISEALIARDGPFEILGQQNTIANLCQRIVARHVLDAKAAFTVSSDIAANAPVAHEVALWVVDRLGGQGPDRKFATKFHADVLITEGLPRH